MLLATEIAKRKRQRKLFELYPDDGPLRRELYPKHLAFFAAGKDHRERAAVAGNRTGKSFGIGGYETALHLTGLYPEWWPGRRFQRPVDVWAAGDTSETTRDIVQKILLGIGGERDGGELGTGLIPGEQIVGEPTRRAGVPGAVDTVVVKHASGGISTLGFKSYDQGRKKFQGTSKQLIWLDEEPPMDVYSECLTRTMTTDGSVICTFTPLEGLTDVALMFLPHFAPAATTH